MKATQDRYLVGHEGRDQVLYGANVGNICWSWLDPITSLRAAESKRRELQGAYPGHQAYIYRLVRVCSVRARKGKQ